MDKSAFVFKAQIGVSRLTVKLVFASAATTPARNVVNFPPPPGLGRGQDSQTKRRTGVPIRRLSFQP